MFGNWPKFTLFRIGSIPVRLDATFILVPIFMISYSSRLPFRDSWTGILIGITCIFLSILLHELGHAFAGRWHKAGVREVVVGGFYGYAGLKLKGMPRGALIRILAAGPLVNFIIFLAIWVSLSSPPVTELGIHSSFLHGNDSAFWIRQTAGMVALVNLTMFVFNVIQAYPLDGGRILGLILDRYLLARANIRIVSGLSILVGLAMIPVGFGTSLILTTIGILIVSVNLRRIRSRRTSKDASTFHKPGRSS